MEQTEFDAAVDRICDADDRYHFDAYGFVREALDFTLKALEKPAQGPARHVSAAELLDGIRRFALQEYGPMARTVLDAWNVHATADFGEIVFNMVRAGILGKTDRDRKEDFAAVFDFEEAFVRPFEPAARVSRRARRQRATRPRGRPAGTDANPNGQEDRTP